MHDLLHLKGDLHRLIASAKDVTDSLAGSVPSRELALTKTKLDEAELWLSQVRLPLHTTREAA